MTAESEGKDGSSFVAQLKRRKVFRVAAVYMATAFVVLEATDLLAEGLALPAWVFRAITLLVIAGFPIAVVLAWAYDLTPEGVRPATSSVTGGAAAAERWFTTRTVALVAGLLITGGAVGWLVRSGNVGGPGTAADGVPASVALAVLPFVNLGSADDEYFADGMSDALRGKLASIDGLTVIASSSTRTYRGSAKSPQEIGRELGVRYLLAGNVRWARASDGTSRVQVSPELIVAENGTTRWQQPFDAVLSDVFEVQGEIAGRVADALRLTLIDRQRRDLATRPTDNLEAYDAYLRASALLQRADLGDATHRLAAEGFARAVELDPRFALAWAQQSYAHMAAYWFYEDRSDARLQAARAAADRALALDPDLPEAGIADGYYWYWGWRQYDRAFAAFERARRLDPNNHLAIHGLGNVRRRQGRFVEAAAYFRRGIELDPRDAVSYRELAMTLVETGELDDADRFMRTAISLAPDAPASYVLHQWVFHARNEAERAEAAIREGIRVVGRETFVAQIANRSWMYWLPLADSTVWSAVENLALTSQVVDTGSFLVQRAEWLRHKGALGRAAAAADSAVPFLMGGARRAGDDSWLWSQLAIAHAIAGRAPESRAAIAEAFAVLDRAPDAWALKEVQYVSAKAAIALGDVDAAIAYLTEALAPPAAIPQSAVRADARFSMLRGDPRFEALLGPRAPR